MTKDCKRSAAELEVLAGLKARVDALYLEYIFPVLATLRLGEDPAAVAAEEALLADAEAAGVLVRRYIMPADLSREDLELLIGQINTDPLLSALLLERPLPAHLDEAASFDLIAPAKRLEAGPACEILTKVVDAAERQAKQANAASDRKNGALKGEKQ